MRASSPLPASVTTLSAAAALAAALAGPAAATPDLATMPLTATAALSLTAPTSASLGNSAAGQTLSGQLGTVTVSDTRGGTSHTWTATVSATAATTTAGGTIGNANISYWSGQVTASSGVVSKRTPGQQTAADAVPLSSQQTAFSCVTSANLSNSTSWNPTLVVTIPSAAAAGVYTTTITHSVA